MFILEFKFLNNSMRIVFILHNLFEIKNGVSNKYIHFIDYLINNKIDYLLITCFNQDLNIEYYKKKYNIIIEKGINIPFYNIIKIPNINYSTLINQIHENDLIIFNGELFMFYEIFIKLKKNKRCILIPNWHTNYDFYYEIYFQYLPQFKNYKNILFQYLKKNIFDGLICTGPLIQGEFLNYNSHIFNANEICLENFDSYKINNYKKKEYNFIFTGRISIEKNIDFLLNIFEYLFDSKFNDYNLKLHILGIGPYLNELKQKISNKIKNNILFYNEIDYHKLKLIYGNLKNRIFVNPSKSETFGKSSMEAIHAGIPLFCIKCPINESLYNEENSFLFETKEDFLKQLIIFDALNNKQKENIIHNGYKLAKRYDQKIVYKNMLEFLRNLNFNELKNDENKNLHHYLQKTIKWSFTFFEK